MTTRRKKSTTTKRSTSKKTTGTTKSQLLEPKQENMIQNDLVKLPQNGAALPQEASRVQVLASALVQERRLRSEYMKKFAQVQKENASLRKQLSEAHEQLILIQIQRVEKDSDDVWISAGLNPGDQVAQDQNCPGKYVIVRKQE